MDIERPENKHKKLQGKKKRAQAYQTYLEHTEERRSRIASIIGCSTNQVEELLQLIKTEWNYIPTGKKLENT